MSVNNLPASVPFLASSSGSKQTFRLNSGPGNLLLIQLICPSLLLPCYFRRMIKHRGINNGFTSTSGLWKRSTRRLPQEIRQELHQLSGSIQLRNDAGRRGTAPFIPELPVPLQEIMSLSPPPERLTGGRITCNYYFITVQQPDQDVGAARQDPAHSRFSVFFQGFPVNPTGIFKPQLI